MSAFSFWWINTRPTKLVVSEPLSYAASNGMDSGGTDKLILQLPLVFHSDGPSTLIVQNLRLVLSIASGQKYALTFMRTVPDLGALPDSAPKSQWARSFPVEGHRATALVCQFQRGPSTFVFRTGKYQMKLEARIGTADWKEVLAFPLIVEIQHEQQLNSGRIAVYANFPETT